MPNQSSVNRSLSTIRTELEILSQNDVLSLPQFQSIMAQLPVSISPVKTCSYQFTASITNETKMQIEYSLLSQQQNGSQSQYTDYRYNPTTNSNPQKMAQEDQDLNHPEHLAHRKVLRIFIQLLSSLSSFWSIWSGRYIK